MLPALDSDEARSYHALLAAAMLLAAPVTLSLGLWLNTRNVAAPYGRYAAAGSRHAAWGPLINGRLAWATQEAPCLLMPLALLAWREQQQQQQQQQLVPPLSSPCGALAAAFLVHYAYRSIVYPLRLRGPKGTALVVWAMAAAFCCVNGVLQGWWLMHACPAEHPGGAVWRVQHVVGLGMWAVGWAANLHSDGILRALRSGPNDTGYRIPCGGLFEWVTAANYFAETIEWTGWALAAWPALAPAAFAAFTAANLAPRAAAHHAWYRARFGAAYPPQRRAFLPFLW